MKKISRTTHGAWLAITIATFVLGSQLARRESRVGNARDGRYPERSEAARGTATGASHRNHPPGGAASAADSQAGTVLPSARESTTPSSRPARLPPLTESQINELAIAATKSSNPIARRKAFDRLLQEMRADSFTKEQAMQMRSALHENRADGEQWRAFDYAWAASDPEAALEHISEIPEKYRHGFTSNMLPGLASVEPQMAIDLVNSREGRQNSHLTGRLLEGLADYDIAFATDYVSQLAADGTPGVNRYMRRLTDEVLSTAGLEEGVAWAEGLSPGPLQADALRSVAHTYTHKDAEGAAAWAEQFVGADQNSRLFGEVVREWGDVEAATRWVDSLEPSLAQRDALSAVYGFRGAREPHEAVQDILNMPPSDDRNFAINGFISGLAGQDPQAAVTWAAEITSPGMRESAMIRAGTKFYQQNQQGATEWFQASGLPESAWNQVTRSR